MTEQNLEQFDDLVSLYDFIERNALNYHYVSDIATIFRKFRDKMKNENKQEEVEIAQREIDIFNSVINDNGQVRPYFTTVDETGNIIVYSDLNKADDKYYIHLKLRLDTTNNPLLLSHYAHILWESREKHEQYAKIAINYYLNLVKIYESKDLSSPEEHYGLRVLHVIKNAYYLARQIEYRLGEVKAEIKRLIFNFSINSSSSFAVKINLIELMLDEKKIFSAGDFTNIEKACLELAKKLQFEKRIQQAINIYELGEKIDLRLSQRSQNWRKLIAESCESLMDIPKGDSIFSLHFCQQALKNYKIIGDSKKIAELERRLDELKRTVKFGQVKTEVDLTKEVEQCREIAKELAIQNPEDIIRVLMSDKKLLPTLKEIKQIAKKETNEHPLIGLFPVEIVDQRGNVPQHFGSDEERRYYRILENYKIFLMYGKIILINSIFFEAVKEGKLNVSSLLNFFRNYSWFSKNLQKKTINGQTVEYNWLSLIMPSLNEYFSQMEYYLLSNGNPNFVLAIDSLTLKVEGLIRDICTFSGIKTFYITTDRQNRSVTKEKDIQALLHEEKLKELINEDDLLFLKFLLVEQAGLHIRHDVAHSFMLISDYNISIMHLLILALLKIGKYDFIKKDVIAEELKD